MLQPLEGYKSIALAVAAPAIYFLMLVLGRRIKRRHGVRLGVLYHLFAIGVAIYAPARAVDFQWPALHHLGAATVLLGAVFIVALVDRYILDLYLSEHHGVSVPKFLRDLARISILV